MRSRAISRRWSKFIGSHLGLARELFTLGIDPDDARVYHVLPDVPHIERMFGHEKEFDPRAGGTGFGLSDAIDRAMGELLERYAAYSYRGANDSFASYRELTGRGERALPPFELYSEPQRASPGCPFRKFGPDDRLGWTMGTCLFSGDAIWVPTQLVSLSYRLGPGEGHVAFPSSSGCAVADSPAAATLLALLELVERDAFMIRWYCRRAPPRLPIEAESLLEGRWRIAGLHLELFDLTVDGTTPVVAATCRETSARNCAFVIAAAARPDVRTAAAKAVLEVAQGRPFVKALTADGEAPGPPFNDLESNVRFYGFAENARYASWFVENREISMRSVSSPQYSSAKAALHAVLADCRQRGVHPIGVDMTTEDMADTGLFACRVLASELVPLSVPRWPPLGHARMVARSERALDGVPDWVPHPFP